MHNIGRSYPRRILRLAALGAPIVYLFGAMLCGLWGANGEQVWAQEGGETEYWVEYDGAKYKYLDIQYYWSFNHAYEYAEYSGDLYVYLDVTKPYVKYSLDAMNELDGLLEDAQINTNALAIFEYPDHYISLVADHNSALTEQLLLDEMFIDEYSENICTCFWVSTEDNIDHLAWYVEIFKNTDGSFDSISYYEEDLWDDSGSWSVLPVNNVLKFGSKPFNSINTTGLNNIINYDWHSESYNQNYTDGIFGNFFPRDNFLVKWGENALGDNPAGFAPFGAFFKYIDDNVTHFRNANQQIGLMAYGYLYYVAHILIADMALLCITFIPKLLDKINDKILGGLDND